MKCGDWKRQEIVALIDHLGGSETARAILQGRELPEVKYGDETLGRWQALIDKLGGATVQRILNGELKVEIVEGGYRDNGKAVLVPEGEGGSTEKVLLTPETTTLLIDRHGRRIPPQGMQAKAKDANWDFCLEQPAIGYARRLAHLTRYFPEGTKFSSTEEFVRHTKEILDWIRGHEQISNLLTGDDLKVVRLPICLPKLEVEDYGRTLEEIFLTAAASSYREQFPDRKFVNHRQGELANQVSIAAGSRHKQLLARMVEGPVTGVFFSNALQGYSIDADCEQVASLPENILLAGGFDTITALTAYPDVLARDYHTPGLDLAALFWQSSRYSLGCWARGARFDFGRTFRLARAFGSSSAGLLVLRAV